MPEFEGDVAIDWRMERLKGFAFCGRLGDWPVRSLTDEEVEFLHRYANERYSQEAAFV
jgi:hypothetical protein